MDGNESEMFGSRGNKEGEFRDPAGLVVDDMGTMMVVDSRNHRLQLVENELAFVGLVKVSPFIIYGFVHSLFYRSMFL